MLLIENICIGTKVHISINLTKQISTDCSADPHLVLNLCVLFVTSSNISYTDYQLFIIAWYK